MHFYGDIIFTQDELISQNPDLVLRFLRATLKGWKYAIENPAQASSLVVIYNPDTDLTIEVEKMEASIPLIHTGEDQIGWMRAEIWQNIHDILLEQGLIIAAVDLDTVYTIEFLEEIYGGSD